MIDPFETLRANAPKAKAVNRMSHEEYDELKNQIEVAYMKHAQNNRLARQSQHNAINEVKVVWLQTLESALAQSKHFQRIILDEEVTPGSHNFSLIELSEEWLLGLYLPGFYDIFDNFSDGYQWIKSEMFPKASNDAHAVLVEMIRKANSRVIPILA